MRNEDRTRFQRATQRRLIAALAASLFTLVLSGSVAASQGFSAAEVYRNSSSSVVLIFGFSESGAGSSGTGSILTADGLILTNNHVVTDSDTHKLFPNLVVYLKPIPISGDNRKDLTTPYLVDVLARDADMDLALLRIKDAPGGLRPMEIGNSDEVEIGESVAAIGHPGGGGLWTLTTGTISSKRQDQSRDIFQTDTAINPGNSGGPLLDGYSRLVGINTFVRRVNAQGLPLEGLNYSLRSSFALTWINQQGVARISSVPRRLVSNQQADGMRPSPPAPSASANRSSTSEEEAEPRASHARDANDSEPRREPDVEPRSDPKPEVKPSKPRATSAAPPADPKAREFKGANGEMMYGVPNPTIDLNEALVEARKGYQALIERAGESVEEMDRLLDDYDNF